MGASLPRVGERELGCSRWQHCYSDVRGSSHQPTRRWSPPWHVRPRPCRRSRRWLRGVGRGRECFGYTSGDMLERCGQGFPAIACTSREQSLCVTIAMCANDGSRLSPCAWPAPIKRDRISISRAFRNASTGPQPGRHRRKDERKRTPSRYAPAMEVGAG